MANGRKLGTWMWIRIACWLVKGRTFPLFLVGTLALAGFAASAFSRTSSAQEPANAQGAAVATAAGQSFAGHWVFEFMAYCYESDVALCDQMNTDVAGAYSQIITITADSDVQGRFTFEYDRMIADNKMAISPRCNGQFFSGQPMTGVCRMTGHGTGYFAPANGTILPVLWITNEWVTFQTQSGAQLVHNPMHAPGVGGSGSYPNDGWNGPYPQALPIPAVPGFYNNAALGNVFGGSPPGDLGDEMDQVIVTRY
jgi:hypothetical protein